MSNSSAVAQQIARSLVAAGVREVVLAPGSRSAPLVYALAPLAEAGVIRTHVRLDERDAGFLALGLARGLRVRDIRSGGAGAGASAVALVTTSGSAVANLHPAVLEASYGHLPLVALTADRPARLRGTGANQTIDDQAQVLTDVRARFDVPAGETITVGDVDATVTEAVARALGCEAVVGEGGEAHGNPGPVQLNIQFDTPLVPTADELEAWTEGVGSLVTAEAREGRVGAAVEVAITDGTVIVAGDAAGWSADTLVRLADDHDLPVLAEPSSPLARSRHGGFVPVHSRVLTERPDLRQAIRTVIVHGKPTLTRSVAALLADPNVRVQRLSDDIDVVGCTGPAPKGNASWRQKWVDAGTDLLRLGDSADSADSSAFAGSTTDDSARSEALARAVAAYLAAEAITLFAASSNTIRYLNELPEIRADIHASRGLAGIDGLVSTATGLSLGLDEQVVLLIGDVALLHDVGGLLTPTAEIAGDLVIVVLNDDGGAIFGGLEHSQPHVLGYLDRYFAVPHGRRFDQLADAYGWTHARVSTLEGFVDAFAQTQSSARAEPTIIEVDLTV